MVRINLMSANNINKTVLEYWFIIIIHHSAVDVHAIIILKMLLSTIDVPTYYIN